MREAWKWETCSVSVFFVRVGSQISPRRAKKDSNIPRSVKCPTPGPTKRIKSPPHALPPAGMPLIGALEETNERIKNIDKSLLNGVIFLDLKKAFDTMDHAILPQKLEIYGVRSQTLGWFKSYVSGRKKKS